MHSDIERGLAMLQAVKQFGIDHPVNERNARAAMLFADVDSAVEDLRTMGGTQEFNRRKVRGSSSERQQIAATMRKLMRQIARVAKVLDRTEFPDARFKLRVPRSNGYWPLLTQASVYLKTVATMKSEFVERGMPADFDARLQALLDQFENATKRKNSSLSGQISSTAGLKARMREAVRVVRELDVILSLLYEETPALYAVWRSASHIQRAPRREKKGEDGSTPFSVRAPALAVVDQTPEAPSATAPILTEQQASPPDPETGTQLAFW